VKILQKFVVILMIMFTTVANANDQSAAIDYIDGRWDVVATFFENGQWGAPNAPARAVSERVLGGAFIRLNMPIAFPGQTFQFEMTFSYDRFNNTYRIVALDDVNAYMDVYSGPMKGDILTATNENTGTAFSDGNGGFVFGKIEIQETKNGFQLRAYTSSGAEEPYSSYMKIDFTSLEEIK
jgi:hypothetical protein